MRAKASTGLTPSAGGAPAPLGATFGPAHDEKADLWCYHPARYREQPIEAIRSSGATPAGPGSETGIRRRTPGTRGWACTATIAAWVLLYGGRALDAHFALRTNAYDLSVFDYALWSTGRTGLGDVPFLGHSLFSQHFMPTLLLLWPAYQAAPSPVFLILLQILALAAAALLLYRLLPAGLPTLPTLALVAAFLFGRRSHSAASSVFYVESLEPLLVFGLLLAWRAGRTIIAATLALLALGCKEDMPIYLGAFGVVIFATESRRRGLAIVLVSIAWLAVALAAVLASRALDGLPAVNPFIEATLDAAPEPRLGAGGTLVLIGTLTAGTGFLCWLAPAWLSIVLPGLLLTLAMNPHTSAGVTGHYLFPLLPWLFVAGASGAERLHLTRPRLLAVVSVLLLLAVVADSPLWRTFDNITTAQRADARTVRLQLERVRTGPSILAMPNLVPHLPHHSAIRTIGIGESVERPSIVVLSAVGDLWPLDAASLRAEIDRYRSDRDYRATGEGPLHVFERVTP